MAERKLGNRIRETRIINDREEVKGLLVENNIVDEQGNPVIPVFKNKNNDEEAKPWEMESLPQTLLTVDSYRTQNIQRIAWDGLIKPFQELRIENGLRLQNLRGYGWQADIVKDWKILWNSYTKNLKSVSDLNGASRKTNEVGPPTQRRKLTG